MHRERWDRVTTASRRGEPRLDHPALVPASLLPHKATYQRLANQLPAGAVLVVLPAEDSPERRTLQEAAVRLRAKGHAIATMSVDEVLRQTRGARPARAPATQPAVPTPPPAPAGPVVVERAQGSTTAGEDVPPFTRELRLVRIDASTAPARFEVWQWQPTLWGGVALVRLRGALGQPVRTEVLRETATPQLDETLRQLVRRRLRAGYAIADWQ